MKGLTVRFVGWSVVFALSLVAAFEVWMSYVCDSLGLMAEAAATLSLALGFRRRRNVGKQTLDDDDAPLAVFTVSLLSLLASSYIAVESLERVFLPVAPSVPPFRVAVVSVSAFLVRAAISVFVASTQTTSLVKAVVSAESAVDFARASAVAIGPWFGLDAFVALSIAALSVRSCGPSVLRSASVLLLASPQSARGPDGAIHSALARVRTLDGVLEVKEAHFWSTCVNSASDSTATESVVGTVSVRVRSDASEQSVVAAVRRLLVPHTGRLTVQVEKDSWVPTSTLIKSDD